MTRKRKEQSPEKTPRIITGVFSGIKPVKCSGCVKKIFPKMNCTFLCNNAGEVIGLFCSEYCEHEGRNHKLEKCGIFSA